MDIRDDSQSRRKTDGKGQRVRILAVDDDRPYLKYLQLTLSRAGFDVELALDGTAAIERVSKQPSIDVLLLDLSMPGIDGIETLRRIQKLTLGTPLYTILLTAMDGTEVKLRALDSGFDDFMTKMSPDSEILAKIRSAARRLDFERRLHVQNKELQSLALTDELTGIANRRALFKAGDELLRSGRRLGVALFDLDRFKQINDTYGHPTGDRILAGVADAFRTHTRFGDLIGRYGGDEFVLLVPDAEFEEVREIADRLLTKIRQLRWTINDTVLTVDAQCGAASSPAAGSTLPDLIASCDQLLYRGKRRAKGESTPELRASH